ncbi:hypothetical protein Tco_0274528, partial [Tanacetum coccineum]
VNVPKAFQKNVVPIKSRSLTFADNLLEIENGAVLLAKSVNTEEQRCQQCDIMTQTTIERQINKDVKDMYAKWRQKLKGPVIEDPTVQSLLDLTVLLTTNTMRLKIFQQPIVMQHKILHIQTLTMRKKMKLMILTILIWT